MNQKRNRPAFTPEATIGPFFPHSFTERMPGVSVMHAPGVGHKAAGVPILVAGRVLNEAGLPIRNMIVEIWQANAQGRYRHPDDNDETRALDPAFDGFARLRTDDEGRYALRTIKPGARSAVADRAVLRAPHLRLTIFGSGVDRLVTFMFFDDEPSNGADPLLQSLDDAALASQLIARGDGTEANGAMRYVFDIVLRGACETPFFDDWSD